MILRFLDRSYLWFVGALCLWYAVIQLIYVSGIPLVMDEFQGARAVQKLTTGIPYRDFVPYKTVLGYYIQLPALLLGSDAWSKVIYIKYEMVLINTACLMAGAVILARHFRKAAVVMGLLVVVCMSTFLERSSALRVDMLTAWFGLFSMLALLERRVVVAGLLASAGFLTSQKGVYYMFAGGLALGMYWLFAERTLRRFIDAAVFTVCALAPILLYFGIFGMLGKSADSVSDQVLNSHSSIVFETLYVEVRNYWFQTIERNPFFYAALILAIGRAFGSRTAGFREWLLWVYGGAVLAGCIWHKQPWPYFFVILVPTGWVLITSLFDGEIDRAGRFSVPAMIVVAALGVGYPLMRVPVVLERDLGPQRNAIRLVEAITNKDEKYLAGVEMVVDRNQPSRLAWLDRNRLRNLNRNQRNKVTGWLQEDPPKALIMNYRLRSFARVITKYFAANYRRLHGNVHVYCPTLPSSKSKWTIPFEGDYRVRKSGKKGPGAVVIDGKKIKAGKVIKLSKGEILYESETTFRLCLEPRGWEEVADPDYQAGALLFDRPYKY